MEALQRAPYERGDGISEADAVQVHDKVDDAPAGRTAPALPDLLNQVHGEPIGAAAHRAWADELAANPPQMNAAAVEFVGDWNGAGPGEGGGVNHAPPPSPASRGTRSGNPGSRAFRPRRRTRDRPSPGPCPPTSPCNAPHRSRRRSR